MPGRRWDDPWQKYPASVPLPVEGGIADFPAAGTDGDHLVVPAFRRGTGVVRPRRPHAARPPLRPDRPGDRDRRVTRDGRRPGPGLARQALSRDRRPCCAQRRAVDCDSGRDAAKVGFAARLSRRRGPSRPRAGIRRRRRSALPGRLERHADQMQLPRLGEPVQAHRGRALLLADSLDTDPWLVLLLRGKDRDTLLGALSAGSSPALAEGSEIAPWWPFAPGPVSRGSPAFTDPSSGARSGTPDAVLDTMEPLAVEVGSAAFVELLRPMYESLV